MELFQGPIVLVDNPCLEQQRPLDQTLERDQWAGVAHARGSSASDDGSVRIWDSTSGDQLAALYAFGQNEWAIVDPVGRFDTNDMDGDAPLHWLLPDDPMHILPLEIFMRDY